MQDVPTFFFSHARQDRETPGRYLRRFFDDLEIKLAQWAGISLEDRKLGTIDARVPQGDNWDSDLSNGLRNDNVFVAILTPLYLNRPNCGKELAVFLLRSPHLGIDQNGAFTAAENVMLIRWLPENAYAGNTTKDSMIPQMLRLIEDTPADDGRDPERTLAIERYRKKGMEKCVQVEPHYGELLDLLVARLRGMPRLPSAGQVSFATAVDAFKYNWNAHFGSAQHSNIAAVSAIAPAIEPQPLASIVVFYITRFPFTLDQNAVAFADSLIAETVHNPSLPKDPLFAGLLSDVRTAAVGEGFTTFHAASNPVIPLTSDPLISRLSLLSRTCVLTALVIDRAIWPGAQNEPSAAVVEQIIRSSEWTGPVLLHSPDGLQINVEELIAAHGLPSRVVALPQDSAARVPLLRRAFVEARGQVLRTRTGPTVDSDNMPILKGVKREGS